MTNDKNLLYFCDPSKNTECRKTGCYENGGPCRHTTHAEYADTTDYAFPATQGTEWAQIVRCKDCKHLFSDSDCPLRTWRTHVATDYCSYGERMEEADNGTE